MTTEMETKEEEKEKTSADEHNKSDDSGIMELATTSPPTSGCQVPRIRRPKKNKKPSSSTSSPQFPANFDKLKVSMGRKIVKKAIKTRQRMENNRNSQNRGFELIQKLCKEQSTEEEKEDDNKNTEFEEMPPRPPTRRCMFYRDDPEPKAVLRVKQC